MFMIYPTSASERFLINDYNLIAYEIRSKRKFRKSYIIHLVVLYVVPFCF